MSKSVKNTILQLLQDENQFNANDILVNLDHARVLSVQNELVEYEFPLTDPILNSIVRSAKKTEKEQGIFPLCITKGIIEWELNQKKIQSPLFLAPCTIEVSKVKNTLKISTIEDAGFINPFLINRLNKEFTLLVPLDIKSLDELVGFLKSNHFLSVESNVTYLGNFHHHRYEIIKELEELSTQNISTALSNLLGEEHNENPIHLSLSSELLFPADLDQLEVFKSFENDHTVVQGPPGTGKSQVLANLIGKLLRKSDSTIVVSEKRVALEVLQKKLQQYDLGDLCFIATSETLTKDVLNSLKSTWNKLEQAEQISLKPNLRVSEQYIDQLQQQLDVLNKEELIGGLSYSTFKDILGEREIEKISYASDQPTLVEWLNVKGKIKELFNKKLNSILGSISYGMLQQDSFKELDRSILHYIQNLSNLSVHFEINTWSDLQYAMKKAALCQNFNNPTFRKHELILTPNSKEQKRFIKLRKKFLQLHFVQTNFDLEKAQWKKFPTQIETESLLNLENNESVFGKWKFKKQWSKYSDLDKSYAKDILHKWKQYLVNKESVSQIKVELCEIGIDDVKSELESVYQQIHFFTSEDWQEWSKISSDERKKYAEKNSELNQLFTHLKSKFRLNEDTNLIDLLQKVLINFSSLVELHETFKNIPENIHRNLDKYIDFDSYELSIYKSNWVKFTAQFPSFSNFKPQDLLEKTHRILENEQIEFGYLAETIRSLQMERFRYYHQLLQTAPIKLKGSEKELRTTLKKGKAILVKEFAKTRNHPSLRELFASEAQIWLRLFKPVWLSNPTQIAKCFPMQQGLFDVAIFDEASQIPLQNALGTIQRANRILVAGDQQQMGPSTYFKTATGEVVDLLHQASFYWKNVPLKHHYRSEHPALIQFSNKHFYNNELVSYPSFHQEEEPISFQYCENGNFDERKNHNEAKAVAIFIEKHIDSKDHLGIVAFSEIQLAEIFQCLKPATQEKLENRIENDTTFFKALENVQGEECDHLIISFGYGKNENGEFHMRFGPLNSKNGPKRLNVLLTRARKKIDFFSSVKAGDFRISSNEAVNLMRQFLLQLENQTGKKTEIEFPLGLAPQIIGNKLIFDKIYTKIKQSNEMVTMVQIMENRGWEIVFG